MLKIEKVNAGYGDVTVLWDINIALEAGKTLAIVGSNGAGKSTIMRTLCGLVSPSAGSITFDGKNISKMAPHDIVKLGIVYVPEGRRLFNKLSVMDNLLVGSYLPQNRKKRAENLERVFEMFPKLHERREQKAGTLSGGEQQMLAIARGLMSCPKVLMLDEPSLGIAPVIVDKLFEIIAQLKKENMTILISEQNVGRVLDIGDDAIVVQSGRIVMSGTCEEIKKSDMIQKAYLGM